MASFEEVLVLSSQQMEVLADPLRSEVMLALRSYGPGSASDLAIRLSQNAKSLYYPLRKLEGAGLIVRSGVQKGKRKSEAVYASVATRLDLPREADPALKSRLVRTTFQIAEKEFQAAQLAVQEEPSIRERLRITRCQLWLSDADLAEFLKRLEQLEQEFQGTPDAGDNLIYWTSIVAPPTRK